MWMAKRVMDIGALGVIFPFASSLERIREATRACRYPPMGGRGCGPTLAQIAWGLDEQKYYAWANKNIMCCVIIEEGGAADDVDELAQVPGIDLLFIGTADLTFSIMGDKSKLADQKV
jgi:2-keto-3-deoxy-L-rhamnonate aldolase RhmA